MAVTRSVDWHRERFAEFCRFEQMTGGPDPHMKAVVEMSRECDDLEKFWRSLIYVGVYNVPTAEAIWREWPITSVAGQDAHGFKPQLIQWLNEHWAGIRVRRERRTTNSPDKIADYLYANHVEFMLPTDFEDLWMHALSMRRVGRYAATKLCETWRRMGLTTAEHPDIRAYGGWSPREALQLLGYCSDDDARDNSGRAVAMAEAAAESLHRSLNLPLSMFALEVMLCEYKESFKTRRQYPGRSLDSELRYELAIRDHWNVQNTNHMRVRPLISPSWALGEIQGWWEPRDECANVLADHGYTWTDFQFDYKETFAHNCFGHPIHWGSE